MTRYEPNEAGWAALVVGPEMTAIVVAEAERGKVFAEGISPVDSGEYRDAFEVEATTVMLGRPRRRRAAAILRNTSGHSAAVEYGNAKSPNPNRVLGKTAAHLGT